jgi:hypothetical protein
MTIQLKRNDIKDTISYSLTYLDGSIVNLTGASVRFVMGNKKTLITDAPATIKNATTGAVEYTLTENDTLVAGAFHAEFEVTFADEKVKTFPNNGYILVNIQSNINKDVSTYIEDQIANRVSDLQIWKNEIQAQLNQFAVGDSSPEIAQSRVEADGTTNTTLKARLDKKEAKFTQDIQSLSSSVAQIAKKEKNLLDYQHLVVNNDWKPAFTQAAIDVLANKWKLKIPDGEYGVSGITDITVAPNQTFAMEGNGITSVIKRLDGVVTADWHGIFNFIAPSGQEGGIVQIDNVCFDGNFRGNPFTGGASGYAWEHVSEVRIGSTLKMKLVRITNTYWKDPISNGLWFNGMAKNVVIDKFIAMDRSTLAVRSDIVFSKPSDYVSISNFNGATIQTELTSDADVKMYLFLSNIFCSRDFDIAGYTKPIFIEATNIYTPSTKLSRLEGSISNSSLRFTKTDTKRLNYMFNGMTFSNVKFLVEPNDDGTVSPVYCFASGGTLYNVIFSNCEFAVDGAGVTYTGHILFANPSTSTFIKVTQCKFDKRLTSSVKLDRCGEVILIENEYAGTSEAITISSQVAFPMRVRIQGGNFNNVTTNYVFFTSIESLTLHIIGLRSNATGKIKGQSATWFSNLSPIINDHVMTVDVAPTGAGVKGDRVVLRSPVAGQAYEWVATVSHMTDAVWKVSKTLSA